MSFDKPFLPGESTVQGPLHGKTLLLIHIGSHKKAFIPKRIKELGVRIVALHTERAAWAEPFVDDWILASQKDDEQRIVDKVRAYQQEHAATPIDGAVTFWEEEVPTLARICNACGFIGNAPQTSFRTRSKFHMQEALRARGCNAMRQALISSPDHLEAAMRSVGFPAVLKPLYGSDSLFVTFVDNASRGRDAYHYVRNNYRKVSAS
jgi:biotin carboxylase